MGRRPLEGRRVIVCRAESDAGPVLDQLAALGAAPLAVPLLVRVPPADGGAALRAALERLDRYAWLVVTSAAGTAAVLDALAARHRSLPPGLRIAAVGPATAAAFERAGIAVDVVPATATAAALAAALPAVDPAGVSADTAVAPAVLPADPAHVPAVLAPLAELAGDDLVEGLTARGYAVDRVDAYRLAAPPAEPSPDAAELAAADAVLFTSPSTVDRYLDRFGPDGVPPTVVCIGPRTAVRARQRSAALEAHRPGSGSALSSPVVAAEHTTAGLVAALVSALR